MFALCKIGSYLYSDKRQFSRVFANIKGISMTDGVDLESLEQLKELMGDKFPQLVETYTRNAQNYVSKILEGHETQNFQQVVEAAHPLKSSSGNLCLMDFSKRAEAVEAEAKKLVAGEGDKAALDALIDGFEALFVSGAAALKTQI